MLGPYVVHLNGSFDLNDAVALRKELAIIDHMGGVVVVDLRGIASVSEEVVTQFARARERLRAAHGQLRLVLDEPLERQLTADAASAPFDFYGSMEAATLDC